MYPVSQRFIDAVNSNHTIASLCTVHTGSSIAIAATIGLLDGAVSVDSTRAQRRSFSASMVDKTGEFMPRTPEDLITPYGNEIRPYRGVKFGPDDSELVPLGVFVITKVSTVESISGVNISIEGVDRSFLISQNKWSEPYVIAPGSKVDDVVSDIAVNRLPTVLVNLPIIPYNIGSTPLVLGLDSTKNDPWQDIIDICFASGYDVFFDMFGVMTARPLVSLGASEAVATYSDLQAKVVTDISRQMSSDNIYNGVIVLVDNSGLTVPIRVETWDNDPSSPTYYMGKLGKRPFLMSSTLPTTVGQAQDMANTKLLTILGQNEEIIWSQIVNPALNVYDTIQIDRSKTGMSKTLLITVLHIPLSASGTMSCTSKEKGAIF